MNTPTTFLITAAAVGFYLGGADGAALGVAIIGGLQTFISAFWG